jgi:fermentation-respiration switch protein FrsA (DUF1100 family)
MRVLVAMIALAFASGACTPKKPPHARVAPDAGLARVDHVAYAKLLVDHMVTDDFVLVTQRFNAKMKEAVSVDHLAKGWAALMVQVGDFKEVKDARAEKRGDVDVAIVTCAFDRADVDVQVSYDANDLVSGFFFQPAETTKFDPPPYAKDDSFHEEPITVGDRDWPLPGKLTTPTIGAAPFPCVVMIQGSGPQDEDETISGNKPFRDLAWGLASQGVATIRFQKRTFAQRLKLYAVYGEKITIEEETVEDAIAAVSLARSRRECAPARIVVLGHSLGGFVAPRIAVEDKGRPPIAGLVILAGNVRPMEDLMLEQAEYLATISPASADDKAKGLAELKAEIARVKDPNLAASTPPTDLPLGIPASYWLDLRSYHPDEVAKTLATPMFIAGGTKDYQVPATDLSLWRAAVGAKANVTIKEYPSLSHIFTPVPGVPGPADYDLPSHVDEHLVDDIAAFVKKIPN